jgi:hypothetical protein
MMALLKERIAERAHEKFVARGGLHGYDLEDWLEAEREVVEEIKAEKKADKKAPQAKKAPAKKTKTSK